MSVSSVGLQHRVSEDVEGQQLTTCWICMLRIAGSCAVIELENFFVSSMLLKPQPAAGKREC